MMVVFKRYGPKCIRFSIFIVWLTAIYLQLFTTGSVSDRLNKRSVFFPVWTHREPVPCEQDVLTRSQLRHANWEPQNDSWLVTFFYDTSGAFHSMKYPIFNSQKFPEANGIAFSGIEMKREQLCKVYKNFRVDFFFNGNFRSIRLSSRNFRKFRWN